MSPCLDPCVLRERTPYHPNPSEMKDRMDGAEVEEKMTFSNEEEGRVRAMRSLQDTRSTTF